MTMERKRGIIWLHAKGMLYSVVITLVFVLILALVVKLSGIGGTPISIITQIIKVIAIFFGVGMVTKYVARRAFLHGALFGIIYTAVIFLVFSILSSNFEITTGFMYDSLFAIAIGVISAVLLRAGHRPVL